MQRVNHVSLQTATDFIGCGYASLTTLNPNKTPELEMFVTKSGVVVVKFPKKNLTWIIPSANVKVAGPFSNDEN